MKARIPEPVMTAAEKKRREEANERSNRKMLNYAHRSLLLSVHKVLGYGGGRLRRLSAGSYDVGEGYIADHTDKKLLTSVEDLLAGAEAEYAETDFFETVEDTYGALRRDLLLFGFDPDISLWGRHPFSEADFPQSCEATHRVSAGNLCASWRRVTASQRKKREAFLFYANEMSQMCRTMLCMGLMELHQSGGIGAERMERVAAPVREDWFRLMRVYLAMDSAGVTQEQKRMRDAFNAMQCFAEEFAI